MAQTIPNAIPVTNPDGSLVGGGGGGGLSVIDAAAWTAGSSTFTPSGGVFNDSATALTSGQQGTQRLTPNRADHVNLRNNAGTEIGTSANPVQVTLANTGANATAVKVDNSGVTQPVSGTFWQATQPISGSISNTGFNVNNTPAVTQSGTWTVQPGNTANTTAWKVDGSAVTQPVSGTVTANAGTGNFNASQTTGGATPVHYVSAASTNATSVKASAGTVYGVQASNINAAARYLKLYDKASSPTVGTDTPVKTLIIPGNTAGSGSNVPIPVCGINFANGIAFALTTGVTDADTGAVAANDIVVNLDYK